MLYKDAESHIYIMLGDILICLSIKRIYHYNDFITEL